MAEWLKAHAWKACIPQGIQGSNPCLSAISSKKPAKNGGFLLSFSEFASEAVIKDPKYFWVPSL